MSANNSLEADVASMVMNGVAVDGSGTTLDPWGPA